MKKNKPVSLSKRLVIVIFTSIALVQVASIIFVMLLLNSFFKEQIFDDLRRYALLLKERNVAEIMDFGNNANMRITIIKRSGEVIFDNQFNPSDNHASREEIRNLLDSKPPISIRKSSTSNSENLYFATFLNDNLILRVSQSKSLLSSWIWHIVPFMGLILLCVLGLSVVIGYFLSKKILNPVYQINLLKPLKTNPYKELNSLMQKISKQKKKIKKTLRENSQKTKQIEGIIANMNDGFLLLDENFKITLSNKIARKILNNKMLNGANLDIIFSENDNNKNSATQSQTLKSVVGGLGDKKGDKGSDFAIQAPLSPFDKNKSEAKYYNNKDSSDFMAKIKDSLKNKQSDCSFEISLNGRYLFVIIIPILEKNVLKASAIILLDKTTQKDALKLRKEFSANVTHEIKTPLSVILASSEMLINGLVKNGDEQEFISKIYAESKRLIELVDKILQISFLDEKAENLAQTPLNLESIITQITHNLSSLAKEKDIQICTKTYKKSTSIVEILGVASLIYDMIYNLCENAIKYSHSGTKIRISLLKCNRGVVLSIKDNGIGIDNQEFERIFERFYCVDKSRSKRLGGSGLGLSIVKHIAKLHNAQIRLKSKLGQGSKFSIIFNADKMR